METITNSHNCSFCIKTYKNYSGLWKHIAKKHSSENKSIFHKITQFPTNSHNFKTKNKDLICHDCHKTYRGLSILSQ